MGPRNEWDIRLFQVIALISKHMTQTNDIYKTELDAVVKNWMTDPNSSYKREIAEWAKGLEVEVDDNYLGTSIP